MKKPKNTINNNDLWFLSPDWQKAEAKAQKDIDCGNVKIFDSVGDLITELSDE